MTEQMVRSLHASPPRVCVVMAGLTCGAFITRCTTRVQPHPSQTLISLTPASTQELHTVQSSNMQMIACHKRGMLTCDVSSHLVPVATLRPTNGPRP